MSSDSFLRQQALAVLDRAIGAEVGIVVRSNDITRARQVLYRFRRELGRHEYSDLQIRIAPDAPYTDLWIFKKSRAPEAGAFDDPEAAPPTDAIYVVNLDEL